MLLACSSAKPSRVWPGACSIGSAANVSAQACAFTLLHNTTIAQAQLDALEATVGDHLGLFPIAYLARARRRGRAHPGFAADLQVALTTVERYILRFPHRVPSDLPASGTFARTGGDPRENSTGAPTFLWGDDQFMGLTLLARFASGRELDVQTRGRYAALVAQMQIGKLNDTHTPSRRQSRRSAARSRGECFLLNQLVVLATLCLRSTLLL